MLVELKHKGLIKACEYIKVNYKNKITTQALREYTGYSERMLQLLFKNHLSQTPFEYLDNFRYSEALGLIEASPQKPLNQIAKEVNLMHKGRFSIGFKKRYGISPSIYRRSMLIQKNTINFIKEPSQEINVSV
jgi:transcriptional regulator GlxA family with amidase domain